MTNRGTISSALGKSLAQEVLRGDTSILPEAVSLLDHEQKDVRAGAAKIVEQTALADPSLVVGYLPQLLPALDLPEPQTRWMAIHTLGLCASLDAATAGKALPRAEAFIRAPSGACLWGASIVYLGYLGETSAANAQAVFPILEHALHTLPRQTKNVLESFLRMLDQTDSRGETRTAIAQYASRHARDGRSGVQSVARRILRKLGNDL